MEVAKQRKKPTKKDIQTIFDCWNEWGPVKHRILSQFKRNINAKLRFYSVPQLCRAIREYQSAHFEGDPRFWYGLTLSEFLLRPDALGFFLKPEIILKDFHEPDFVDFRTRQN